MPKIGDAQTHPIRTTEVKSQSREISGEEEPQRQCTQYVDARGC